jgi:phosphatidylinositol-4-phosphate 3-kinase
VLRSELEKIPQETLERLRLPLNPGVEVTAILADECSYFNSNSVPLRLLFKNSDMHGFKIDTMYKVGDDLRQDALTMQLIGIMNKLWLKEGLDLKMVTYRCLPTGSEIGMVELVQDAQTLREIQTEYGLAGSSHLHDVILALVLPHLLTSSPVKSPSSSSEILLPSH